MNRKYTTAEYAHSCGLLRRAYVHPAITTDVIVGFPGETEEEFACTEQFLQQIHFYEMHVFQYSKRHGTRAERMPDQIPEPVKKERSARLLALEVAQSKEYRDYYVGKRQTVLFEEAVEIDGARYMVGFTPEYVRVAKKLTPTETEADYANHLMSGVVGQVIDREIYAFETV